MLCGSEQAWLGAFLHCLARLGHPKIALKVQKSAQDYTDAAMDEIKILKQIAEGDPDDKKCVVKLLDHFKHSGPNGQHVCMVFEYLGNNLLSLIKYSDSRGVPLHMVKELCFHMLVGLDYLHQELSIIHTDLKPENVLLCSMIDPLKDPRKSGAPIVLPATKDNTVSGSVTEKETKSYLYSADLTKDQKKEIRKKAKNAAQCDPREKSSEDNERDSNAEARPNEDSTVERSRDSSETKNGRVKGDEITENASTKSQSNRRGSRSTRQKLLGAVDSKCKLVDFGNACWTYKRFTSDIQTRQYRCPEVIIGSKYSTSADMWSFACICFELATGVVLFDPHSGENYDRDKDHLALMVELLGMMSRKTALGGRYSQDFFNRYGELRHTRRLRFWPLDKVLKEKYNFSEQDANAMADFIVPILDFLPEKRPTATQCLTHPWINPGPNLLRPSGNPESLEEALDEKIEKGKDEMEASVRV
ncbi:PREDICTED: serine/threonine-protein kinase SRPK-like isoform X2 [Tarenaya hassleriana]|uniref:serine/threonine-protein kinase SRPK-like isoform X2 n=1 Tax=Tarenaya hassleriana TaxID=28532 RepID=UPI00053C96AD|nr:PREDICTED: serine/threonine-protein kinase SRPK-like isoform X2 [Tarenaya hassleriana]